MVGKRTAEGRGPGVGRIRVVPGGPSFAGSTELAHSAAERCGAVGGRFEVTDGAVAAIDDSGESEIPPLVAADRCTGLRIRSLAVPLEIAPGNGVIVGRVAEVVRVGEAGGVV